jgi:hypothetical protein
MTLPNFIVLTLFSFLLLTFLSCKQASNETGNLKTDTAKQENTSLTLSNTLTDSLINKNNIEEKLIDTISKLPEVKERAKYIEQQTQGKRHLIVWVEDTLVVPDRNYYWIKAGEDNGAMLVTHFDFYVYPDSMRIMYYDTVADSVLTLDEWRKVNGR